jgi:hypothetical protein
MAKKKYNIVINLFLVLCMVVLLLWATWQLFIVSYIAVFVFVSARTLYTIGRKRMKLLMLAVFSICLVVQILAVTAIWNIEPRNFVHYWWLRLVCVLLAMLPLFVSRYVLIGKNSHLDLPSIREVGAISFATFSDNLNTIKSALPAAKDITSKWSARNLGELIKDLPRHDFLGYANDGSLSTEYFERAFTTLPDPYMYVVISSTGTVNSEIISVISHTTFNHCSLSFDEGLETIVSYNGGGNLYRPGLNAETISELIIEENAKILIYRLPCTSKQKNTILEAVRKINGEGSSYNMLGVFANEPYKANIMYCSQFLYKMLELAELDYFEHPGGGFKPTDFIEKDYYRQLEFVKELRI